MLDALVIGDGPGGLSAALFLAKNGLSATVIGQDKTAMHAALLRNYLGIREIPGSDFQKIAREQVTALGATLLDDRVTSVAKESEGFRATTEAHGVVEARYLILSEGKGPKLARTLGLTLNDHGGIDTDRDGRTALDRVYAVGRTARPGRSQAIISAGDGAAAAIDILSRERGRNVTDWDT